MALKLRVISDHYRVLGKLGSRVFSETGGSIGRTPDNAWVLPDPDRYVSSHHCRVFLQNGAWMLEDTSTNGVFVNGSSTPVAIEGIHTLQDGDRLRLGEYEIIVSLSDRKEASTSSAERPALREEPLPEHVLAGSKFNTDDLGEELDLMSLLGPGDSAPSPAPRAAPEPRQRPKPPPKAPEPAPPKPREPAPRVTSLLDSTSDEGPQRTVVTGKRTPDWQLATRPYEPMATQKMSASPPQRRQPAARPAPVPRSQAQPGSLDAGVEALCRGAGIDPTALSVDAHAALLTLAGQMLRETVLGLMEALRVRGEFKERMQLERTTIQPGDNNPLKFASGVDDALVKLLDAHSNRFVPAVEALRQGFADLKTHQQAVDAALKAALGAYLERFAPQELEERFARGLKRGALLGAANKSKYWDLYADFYNLVTQKGGDGLPPAFAEELGSAYDAKSEELGQRRRR